MISTIAPLYSMTLNDGEDYISLNLKLQFHQNSPKNKFYTMK